MGAGELAALPRGLDFETLPRFDCPSAPETVTRHGYINYDEFSEGEVSEAQEALGWSDEQTNLVMFGPSEEGNGYGYFCEEMGPFEAERIIAEAHEEEEREYRKLLEDALELRERERERGQWGFDESFQSTPNAAATVVSRCHWGRASGARGGGSYRGGHRRIVRTSSGPPGRPRPASGDDDPPPDDVVLPQAVAA